MWSKERQHGLYWPLLTCECAWRLMIEYTLRLNEFVLSNFTKGRSETYGHRNLQTYGTMQVQMDKQNVLEYCLARLIRGRSGLVEVESEGKAKKGEGVRER